MNLPLKIALLRAGMRQIDLARKTGLGESRVSRIVNPTFRTSPTRLEAWRCGSRIASTEAPPRPPASRRQSWDPRGLVAGRWAARGRGTVMAPVPPHMHEAKH